MSLVSLLSFFWFDEKKTSLESIQCLPVYLSVTPDLLGIVIVIKFDL